MIIERIPEIECLTAEEKLILAEELWRVASEAQPEALSATPEQVRLLEERWGAFENGLDSGVPWETVRKRVFPAS